MTHPTMTVPKLPRTLPDPINVELHAHDACWPPEPEPWWRRLWPQRERFDPVPMWHTIGWAAHESEPEELEEILALDNMRFELSEREDRPGYDEEGQFESPTLLQADSGLSPQSRAVLQRLVDQRRAHALTPTVLALPNKPDPYLPDLDPGYTLAHHATGIMASFYLQHTGFGGVFAKSYSNTRLDPDLVPPEHRRTIPQHFYGYGVGRRLYLTAHALWPEIRWEDGALRSTSHALRSRLHTEDPYTWHDKTCPNCSPFWRSITDPAELRGLHE